MGMIKRIFLLLLTVVVLLTGVVLFNTFTFKSKQVSIKANPIPEINAEALKHLSEAIAYQTVSYDDSLRFDSTQFIAFRNFLHSTYPLVHEKLRREIVAGYSLLYTWEGKNKDVNPVILLAHQDVVPIEEGTQSMWSVEPFAGTIKDNFIWGRGSNDNKINLIGILEVIEKLLKENFQPERTIYLAFGHDEELEHRGAIAMARLLKSRNVKAELVFDEGAWITRQKVPGLSKAVALIGTSEKGYLTLSLKVDKMGGHSSYPASETAIDILARAVVKLREKNFEAEFTPSTQGFIEAIGPEMPFVQKMAFANMWLFKPMVTRIYEQSGEGNAFIRTTIAPTIFQAGIKENAVPTVANAIINFRLLPGDSSKAVIERVNRIIDDERVQITIVGDVREATSVTSTESFAYQKVDQAVRKTYDGIITTPFLFIAATDSRYFNEVSEGIIRFSPMIDPIGMHGVDERVSLESFQTTLWFFEQLIKEM